MISGSSMCEVYLSERNNRLNSYLGNRGSLISNHGSKAPDDKLHFVVKHVAKEENNIKVCARDSYDLGKERLSWRWRVVATDDL